MPTAETPAVVVAFDGPPGAGKTSLLARLAPAIGDRCVFFTEPNITLARQPCPPVDPTPAERSLWFLRHEQAKARRCATLLADPATRLLVLDRNHLGALAYCYATRVDGALPYARAADFYAGHIAPHLPADLRTVILLVSPDRSLKRRGGAAERARWARWFDPELLDRLYDFYVHVAPELCPNPPIVIDTDDLSFGDVLGQVRDALSAAGLGEIPAIDTPIVDGLPDRPAVTPVFADAYSDHGGLESLGHPLTELFAHRGGWVQLCQLGALHHTPAGNVRIWDPLGVAPEARPIP